MRRIETSLPGVCLLEPRVFTDPRGFFLESYNEVVFHRLGIRERFVQDNHSKSFKGTLRGLHYQLRHPQAKICRAIQGEVMDVVVDVRPDSPTFGRWVKARLSAENRLQIYVPIGFAHGFLALSDSAELIYKCSDFYDAQDERGVIWNDPELAIDWPTQAPILSDRDRDLPRLSSVSPVNLPGVSPGA